MNQSVYLAIIEELETQLLTVKTNTQDFVELTEKSIGLCDQVIMLLRNEVLHNGFENDEEEIYFFKHVKPRVYSKFIFYTEVFNLEALRPKEGRKLQLQYLRDKINQIRNYLNENSEFYHYYKRNRTDFDASLFIRGNSDLRIHEDNILAHTDPAFSTGYDYTLAKIMAHEQLKKYVGNEINKLKIKQSGSINENDESNSNLYWTNNKVDAVELVYALFYAKVINHGKADKIEIARAFEKMFNIDLKNFYHTFTEIQRRNDQTTFLKHLIVSLQKSLDDLEK